MPPQGTGPHRNLGQGRDRTAVGITTLATPLPPVASCGSHPAPGSPELTAPAKGSQGEEDQGVRAPHGGRGQGAAPACPVGPLARRTVRAQVWPWRARGARTPPAPAGPQPDPAHWGQGGATQGGAGPLGPQLLCTAPRGVAWVALRPPPHLPGAGQRHPLCSWGDRQDWGESV